MTVLNNENGEPHLNIEEKSVQANAHEIKPINQAENKEKVQIVMLGGVSLQIQNTDQLPSSKKKNERILIAFLILIICIISALSFFVFRNKKRVEMDMIIPSDSNKSS